MGQVPQNVFMEEASLGVSAFSSITAMEIALREMGFPTQNLTVIADALKEEPMRQAAEVCMNEYRLNSEVPLMTVMEKILVAWKAGFLLRSLI